jgi:hypothetical protein
MKNHPVEGELLYMYRWTDRYDEAKSRFFAILQTHLKIKKNLVQSVFTY